MISCSDYDYVEIVCLFHYPVKLTMKSGLVIEGIAHDTARDESKAESIALETDNGLTLVVLEEISTLEIIVENPHFSVVSFGSP